MTDQTAPTQLRRSRPPATDLARAALAAVAVLALTLGLPAALIALAVVLPVDLSVLRPDSLTRVDDGRLLLVVVLGLGWVAWAGMTVSLVAEALASVRRTATPSVPGLGGLQRLAAVLVASLTLATSAPIASAATVGCDPGDVVARVHDQGDRDSSESQRGPAGEHVGASVRGESTAPGPLDDLSDIMRGSPDSDVSRSAGSSAPVVTTQRHDTLWMLAEQYLGDGARFPEIVALNAGAEQPDGRSLGADGRIYPGWTLTLPPDAATGARRPARHMVEPGDTLWDIADEELGDPRRYGEIVQLNEGDLQPDGKRLTDPDVILPGWVLEIPGDDPSGSGAVGGDGTGSHLLAESGSTTREGDQDEPLVDPTEGGLDPDGPERLRLDVSRSMTPAGRGSSWATDATPTGGPVLGGEDVANDREGSQPDGSSERAGAALGAEVPAGEPITTLPPGGTGSALGDCGPVEADPGAREADPGAREADLDAGVGVTLPAGGTVATLVLAGFAGELARRRRLFQRYRRPGERMRSPGPSGSVVETAARDAAAWRGAGLADRSLRQVVAEARSRGLAPPDVRMVRVTKSSVVLDVMSEGQPLPPFQPDQAGRWELDPTMLAAEANDDAPAYPALVTVGCTESEVVLLNLESVGTLVVSGDAQRAADVMRGFSAELAFGPISGSTSRTLCLVDSAVADGVESGGISVQHDPERVSRFLARRIQEGQNRAGPQCRGAREVTQPGMDDDPVEVVLADAPLGVSVPPGCGAALITSAGVAGSAVLHVLPTGGAVLLPERVTLFPQSLPPAGVGALVDALRSADLPADDPAAARPRSATVPGGDAGFDSPPGSVIDLRDRSLVEPSTSPESVRGDEPPRVLLLGEVQVVRAEGRAESSRIGRLSETAAFVLLNPGARPSDLQSALWPGRRSNPQTCRQMISRARTWLGRTAAGEPYLMAFSETNGRLRLRDEVSSDWADFQRLAEAGMAADDDLEQLSQALRLVRGRPFGSVASRELPWADLHINDMVSLITDVSHTLAMRHLRAGARARARDAALRGLLTESESEILEAIVRQTG